jgi:hypothetical protein
MSMNRRIATTAIVAASSAALMLPTVAPAQAANFDLEAQMRPAAAFPHVRGQAEFDHEGTFHEFEISIHHAGRTRWPDRQGPRAWRTGRQHARPR